MAVYIRFIIPFNNLPFGQIDQTAFCEVAVAQVVER